MEEGTETFREDANTKASDIESQIKEAMRSRVSHFKEQADSLTFEGVRRLVEEDLGMEKFSLDAHKRFIKQYLLKCLDGGDDNDTSKSSGDSVKRSSSREEISVSAEAPESIKDVKEPSIEDEEKLEESPILGLLKGSKTVKPEVDEAVGNGNKLVPTEITIKKAINKRASYIRAKSEEITMARLRRLLEEDLQLDEYALDPCKKFISQQLDEVLKSPKIKPVNGAKKDSKAAKVSHKERSGSSDQESDKEEQEEEEEEEEVKPRKKGVPKETMENNNGLKKRKRLTEEKNLISKKQRKPGRVTREENSDAEDSQNISEDDHPQSSSEKPSKKKEASAPTYSKHVEHLKSVIKACGMSVPPSVYKKVKQVPESKRESQLIKELEGILSREGLSQNPSEKEIKEVRKKKERAKELEGIDMSNIVSTSRRRSTSFVPPSKPKVVEAKADDAEDTDDDKEEEEEDEEEEEEEEVEEDEENSDDESQSDFNEDDEDSD